MLRHVLAVAALLLAAAPATAQDDAGFDDLSSWLNGDWVDPRLHRCGQVWVRIAVEQGAVRHYTVTYGQAVPGMRGEILEVGDDGITRIYNAVLGAEQHVRFVTEDAHVLERADGAGGVTFVRCPESPDGHGS